MDKIIRSSFNLLKLSANVSNSFKYGVQNNHVRKMFSRTLWYSSFRNVQEFPLLKPEILSYNLNSRSSSTKTNVSGERELLDFLEEEIENERKLQKSRTIPSEIDGFEVHLDGSEVSLVKKINDETIKINFNINHSVEPLEEDPEVNATSAEKNEYEPMKSKPSFEVNIKKGDQTLGFTCSFVADEPQIGDDEYTDIFTIDELTIYSGEWNDKNYAVSGEVLDSYMYDLLMNVLEDKGISNEFVEKVSELSTAYEHSTYINLLADLKKFVSK